MKNNTNNFIIENNILVKYTGNDSTVIIPDTVTAIGSRAFFKCPSVISVTIPNSVTTICKAAFFGCRNLERVTIPNSVTTIENDAFLWCFSLSAIKIPSSVVSIGVRAFEGCRALVSIKVDKNNKKYTSDAGVLFNKRKTNLISYPANKTNKTYRIPEGVTKVSDYAFAKCRKLKSVVVPETVKRIGNWAFENCTELTSVKFNTETTKLGEGVFAFCEKLPNKKETEEVVLPSQTVEKVKKQSTKKEYLAKPKKMRKYEAEVEVRDRYTGSSYETITFEAESLAQARRFAGNRADSKFASQGSVYVSVISVSLA